MCFFGFVTFLKKHYKVKLAVVVNQMSYDERVTQPIFVLKKKNNRVHSWKNIKKDFRRLSGLGIYPDIDADYIIEISFSDD